MGESKIWEFRIQGYQSQREAQPRWDWQGSHVKETDLMEKNTHLWWGGGSFKSVTSLRSSLRFRKPERAENWSLVSGKLFVGVSKPIFGNTHIWSWIISPAICTRPFRRSWVVLPSSTKLGPETWVVPAVIIMTWGSAMAPWLVARALNFQNNYHTWCIIRFHHDLALSKTHPLKFLYSKCKSVALIFYQNSSHNGHQQHLPCLSNEAKPAIIRAFLAATGRSLAIHQSQQPVEFVVWEQSMVFLERQGMANHMYPYVMYLYWRFFSFWRPFMAKSTYFSVWGWAKDNQLEMTMQRQHPRWLHNLFGLTIHWPAADQNTSPIFRYSRDVECLQYWNWLCSVFALMTLSSHKIAVGSPRFREHEKDYVKPGEQFRKLNLLGN